MQNVSMTWSHRFDLSTEKITLFSGHPAGKVDAAQNAVEVTKAGTTADLGTTALSPQVGGTCSIVHVLEWKEGMAILPGSNLKVIIQVCMCFFNMLSAPLCHCCCLFVCCSAVSSRWCIGYIYCEIQNLIMNEILFENCIGYEKWLKMHEHACNMV